MISKTKKILAGILSVSMLATAIPVVTAMPANVDMPQYTLAAAETKTIYANDFEDGSVGSFVPRMNEGQSVVLTAKSDASAAYEGSGYLECTGREKSWQGISLPMDNITDAGKEYMVSAYVKTPWYATITLSMQYDDTSGNTKYGNITNAVSQGEWIGFENIKFSFPADSTNRSIYFECSDANVQISLDNFNLTTAPVHEIQQDIPSLKNVYADYFKFGGAVTATELASESAQNLILKHYNSLTPGNELKPESLLDQAACQAEGDNVNPQINIAPARSILNFARDNNIPVRGHVLVWHSQTPGWFFKEGFKDDGEFVSKEIMLKRMENYIKNVMEALAKEYPTVDFYAWDVVNETWLDDGSYRTRGTYDENPSYLGWVQVFGDNSFIDYAFEYARKYAPEGCKLYYNDFNEYMPQKTAAIVDMANRLKEKNLIDGIGMQSHLDVRSGSDAFPSVSVYKKAVAAFAATGLDIQVTELDATVNGNTEELFEAQAQYYSDILDVCVEYADNISAVVLWGTTDDKSWRASKYPLVFNEDFTAKPAFYSIVDGIEYDEPTTEPTTTEPVVTTTVTTTTETTTTEITTPDCAPLLEYDDSPIKVGETKAIKYSHPYADTGKVGIYKASSNISYEIDEVNHIIYVTALEAGEAKISIELEGCAFIAHETFIIEDSEETKPSETDATEATDDTIDFGTASKLGDVNCDGDIATTDLIELAKYTVNAKSYPLKDNIAAANADVNSDKTIDSLDVQKLVEYLLEAISKF